MKKTLKIFAVILVLILVSGAGVVYAFSKPPQTPDPNTTIQIEKGSATINGEKAVSGQELKQGDNIKTAEDTLVTINFYDKSTSRLGANSELKITTLSTQNGGAQTKVSLKISLGHIWSRVVKMVDKESSFEVETPTTVATVRGTAFDAEVTESGTDNVAVTENIVTVAINDASNPDQILATTDLSEGSEATLDTKNMPKDPSGYLSVVKELDPKKSKSEWFTANEAKDKEFENYVTEKEKEAISDQAGITPDSPLYGLKNISQQLRTSLTFDESTKTVLINEYANQKLAEAGKMLNDGKNDFAEKAMTGYSRGLENALANLDQLKNKGQTQAYEQINQKIQEGILASKNLVASSLPDSPMYQLKQKIEASQLKTARDVSTQIEIQLDQASERIKEAKKLMGQGKDDYAKNMLDEYGKNFEAVKGMAAELKKLTQGDALNKILDATTDKAIRTQQLLKTMEDLAPPEIKQEIYKQKMDALGAANEMVKDNIEKSQQFLNEVIKNSATSIPKEFLDKGKAPEWLKNANQAQEKVMQQVRDQMGGTGNMPINFTMPDFGQVIPPSARPTADSMPAFDMTQFIPKGFTPISKEELLKMQQAGSLPPQAPSPENLPKPPTGSEPAMPPDSSNYPKPPTTTPPDIVNKPPEATTPPDGSIPDYPKTPDNSAYQPPAGYQPPSGTNDIPPQTPAYQTPTSYSQPPNGYATTPSNGGTPGYQS